MTMPSSYILFHAVDEKRLAVYSEDSNESWFHQKCWGSGSLPGPVLAKKVEQLRGLNGALGTGVILRKLLDLLFGILLLVHGAS